MTGDNDELFKPGDKVSTIVDWERRFDNMQQHSGSIINPTSRTGESSLLSLINRGFLL